MKSKLLVAAFALSLMAVVAVHADTREGPHGSDGKHLDSWDYGGVDYSTVTFSSAAVMLFPEDGVVVGFIASSPTVTGLNDYISFWDTDTLRQGFQNGTSDYINVPSKEAFRLYMSSVNTTIGTGGGQTFKYGTVTMLPAPIRFVKGCAYSVSTNAYNLVTVLYHKFSSLGTK